MSLRRQDGSLPPKLPLERQIRLLSPLSVNPLLQVYSALLPTLVLVTLTLPLGGSLRGPQVIAITTIINMYNELVYSGDSICS